MPYVWAIHWLYRLSRYALPFLRVLPPETAHTITLKSLKALPIVRTEVSRGDREASSLAVEAFGLRFPNPVGLAAGFDKNAEVPDAMFEFGFGFVEVGTLTPRPQRGNPRPRVFRLPAQRGVINRLGFNNEGHEAARERLRKRGDRHRIVGVNIGASKDSEDKTADYVAGISAFAGLASYFTLNVSSPNTPGLRALQEASVLDPFLARVLEARDAAQDREGYTPVLLKVSPDLSLEELDGVIGVAKRRKVDGLIVSNTTITRPSFLKDKHISQAGGLSGRPVFFLSTSMLAHAFLRVEGAFPLIGVGGVENMETAWAKIEAGASLVQLYTALTYNGPGMIKTLLDGLEHRLQGEAGILKNVVGRKAKLLSV